MEIETWDVEVEELDSTNNAAKRLLQNAPKDFGWIAARRQTQGRGRQGRTWVSETGNLMLSIAVSVRETASITWIPHLTAVSILEAIKTISLKDIVWVKWPNDLLIDGKKVAGVLVEKNNDWLIIGIGVNVLVTPSIDHSWVTSLDREIPEVDWDIPKLRAEILSNLKRVLEKNWSEAARQWRPRYLEKMRPGLGEPLSWTGSDQKVYSGRVSGLGDHGQLQVKLNTGELKELWADEVHFRRQE